MFSLGPKRRVSSVCPTGAHEPGLFKALLYKNEPGPPVYAVIFVAV